MSKHIIDVANTYMSEHGGELPLLILAQNDHENRIIRCHLREKRSLVDQHTFINVMRLAMIVYGYTSYEFVVKPEFNYQSLQMTKDVWAVGSVSPQYQSSEFFELVDDKLVPYFEEMPIGGYIAELLPSEDDRQRDLPPKVVKQLKTYIENCTYVMPVKKEVDQPVDGLDALFAAYA